MRGYNIEDPKFEFKKEHVSDQRTSGDSEEEKKGKKKSFFRKMKRKRAQLVDESSSEDSREEKSKKSFFGVIKSKIMKRKKTKLNVSEEGSIDKKEEDVAILEKKSEEVNFIDTNFVEQNPTEPTGDMKLLMESVFAGSCNALSPLRENMFTQPTDDVLLKTEVPVVNCSESSPREDFSPLAGDVECLFTPPPINDVFLQTSNPLLDSSKGNVLTDDDISFWENGRDGPFTIDVLPEVQNPIVDFIGENYAITEEVAPSTDNHGLDIPQFDMSHQSQSPKVHQVLIATDVKPDVEPMSTIAKDHEHKTEIQLVDEKFQINEIQLVDEKCQRNEIQLVDEKCQTNEIQLVDEKCQTNEIQLVDEKCQANELQLIDEKCQTNEIQLVDEKCQTNEIQLVDEKCQTNEIQLVDEKCQTNEIQLVDEKCQTNEIQLVDEKCQTNEIQLANQECQTERIIIGYTAPVGQTKRLRNQEKKKKKGKSKPGSEVIQQAFGSLISEAAKSFCDFDNTILASDDSETDAFSDPVSI